MLIFLPTIFNPNVELVEMDVPSQLRVAVDSGPMHVCSEEPAEASECSTQLLAVDGVDEAS